MKQVEIARALGITPANICRCVAKGMPTDSIEAAKLWRDSRKGRPASEEEISNRETIANVLGLSPKTIRRAVKAGMPTDSIEAVKAWRAQRAEVNRRNTMTRLLSAQADARLYVRKMKSEKPNEYRALLEKCIAYPIAANEKMRKERPEEYRALCKKRMDTMHKMGIGAHGLGRMHIGRPDHPQAKEWTIQSPDGKRYTFPNLLEWCRQNEHLFDDDEREYKTPLPRRAESGMAQHPSWRGWIVIDRGPLPTTTKR